jgi:hypothetical protein
MKGGNSMTSYINPENIFGRGRQVHAITAWNPSPKFAGPAEKGIRLWTNKLERLKRSGVPEEQVYTWFGKVSISGPLGMENPKAWASAFNEQIENSGRGKRSPETHLYMYCGYFFDERPGSLHVGKIDKVVAGQNEVIRNKKEEPHIPMEFYEDLIAQHPLKYENELLVPYWFKITDIREIRINRLENLERLVIKDNGEFEYKPFFTVNFNSPFPVFEKTEKSFFSSKELKNFGLTGWWEEANRDVIVLHDALSDAADLKRDSNVIVVRRKPKDMAECVSAILSRSDEILFVDPYFDPDKSEWWKPLKEFLSEAAKRTAKIYRIEYHTCEKKGTCTWDELVRKCESRLPSILPDNWKITVYRWKEKDQPFHARFILTEKAGVLFEHGLSEGKNDGDQVLVLLSPHVREDRWSLFQESSSPYTDIKKKTFLKR